MNKKGVTEMVVLASLIIGIISIIVLGGFTQRFMTAQENLVPSVICKNSIRFASSKRVPDFDCELKREENREILGWVTIREDDFDKSADDVEDLVKRRVADLMYECWGMAVEGLVMPYPAELATIWTMCGYYDYNLICSVVSFEDIEGFSLNEWMTNHGHLSTKKNYFEFLYKGEQIEKRDDYINTSKEYAIVWKSIFFKSLDSIPYEVEDAIPVKLDVSKKQWNGVVFVPYSEIMPKSMTPETENVRHCIFVMN